MNLEIFIVEKNKYLNHSELAGLINKSSYVIANDTGPAHMAAHLGRNGIVLFGQHTTPEKVSIETDKFKAITCDKLENLTAEKVYEGIKDKIIFNFLSLSFYLPSPPPKLYIVLCLYSSPSPPHTLRLGIQNKHNNDAVLYVIRTRLSVDI